MNNLNILSHYKVYISFIMIRLFISFGQIELDLHTLPVLLSSYNTVK